MPFILAVWVICGVNIGRLALTQEHRPAVTHVERYRPTSSWEDNGRAYTVRKR